MHFLAVAALVLVLFCCALGAWAQTQNPRVRLETSQGVIVVELFADKAPKTVKNFIDYASEGFFDDTVFHRVIKGFMIQGGGLTADMQRKTTHDPIPNEADNGLKNLRGTVAMARTPDPHSASSQFFINTVDNGFLDHRDKTQKDWGYCVFGKVVEGMEVVEAIEGVPTTVKGAYRDVPAAAVVIRRVALEKDN